MPPDSESVVVQSGNASLSATIFPRIESETVILLHGGPGVPDDMSEVRDWLVQYFQVINFDQRGTGKGVNQDCTFTITEYINDLNAIAEYFKLGKFHLFGHSWGGVYAQLYATVYPEKILSLFLCSPASGTGKVWTMSEREVFLYNYRRSTLSEWLGMSANTILGMMGNQKAYINLFRQLIINYHKGYKVDPPDDKKLSRIGARAGTLTRREIKRYPELKPFSHTPYPVIITYGDNDAFGKSRQHQLNRFPLANKLIIPSSGHTPWKHNPHVFQNILRSFYLG